MERINWELFYFVYWKDDTVSAYCSDTDREIDINKICKKKGEDWCCSAAEYHLDELEGEDRLYERNALKEIGVYVEGNES